MIVHFAGLGSMGSGMAAALARAGHEVHGADPTPAKVDALARAGGHALAAGAPAAGAVVTCVMNAAQTRDVLFGAGGLAAGLAPGGVIVSCATVPPSFAAEMEAEAAARGLLYLDAPISGGAARAAEGTLSIMASGAPAAFDAAAPVLGAMAASVHRMGDRAGAGSAMKAVNQLLAGIHVAATGEALAFAASQGLDLGRVVGVVAASAGTSWMFENRAPHVVDGDYAPRSKVDIWPKDLGIVTDIAEEAGLPLPLVRTALAQFRAASEAGLGAEDDAALAKHVAAAAGIALPGRR